MRSVFVVLATALAVFSQATSALPVNNESSVSAASTSFHSVPVRPALVKKSKVRAPRWLEARDPSSQFSKRQLSENPKRQKRALVPRASATVSTCSQYIQVVNSAGCIVGYVSSAGLSTAHFPYDSLANAACFTPPTAGTSGNVVAANPGISGNVYLGSAILVDDGTHNLKTGSTNYGGFTLSTAVPAGSGPTLVTTDNQNTYASSSDYSETAIWAYSSSGVLTPSWINSDSTSVTPTILTSSSNLNLYITGDVSAFEGVHGTAYFSVSFIVVSASSAPVAQTCATSTSASSISSSPVSSLSASSTVSSSSLSSSASKTSSSVSSSSMSSSHVSSSSVLASKTSVSSSASASATASSCSHNIQVLDASSNIIGYFSNAGLTAAHFKYDVLANAACFTPPAAGSSSANVVAYNNGSSNVYLGSAMITDDGTHNLKANSTNYAAFTLSTAVASGSTPTLVSGDNQNTYGSTSDYSETAIWAYSSAGVLTPSWINADGTSITPTILTSSSNSNIYSTGSVSAFEGVHGTAYFSVTLKVVAATRTYS